MIVGTVAAVDNDAQLGLYRFVRAVRGCGQRLSAGLLRHALDMVRLPLCVGGICELLNLLREIAHYELVTYISSSVHSPRPRSEPTEHCVRLEVELRHPNLFIIGAPKGGTTSLHAYLRQHPQIFLSQPKEPNHFAYADGNPYGWPHSSPYWDRHAYLSLFQGSGKAKIVGEASTCYCLMPHVPTALYRHNPDAKILAILREPVQRAWSMYLYWQQFNKDCHALSIHDFCERFRRDDLMTAVDQASKKRVKWLRGAGMYWQNLQHFYSEFPADQIHLVSYDEFLQRPQDCLSNVCNFLEVDNFAFDTSVRLNKTLVPRFRRLYNFVNLDVDNPFRRLSKRLFRRVLRLSDIRHLVNRFLLSSEGSHRLPDDITRELAGYYKDDLKQLMSATGFDTRAWTSLA